MAVCRRSVEELSVAVRPRLALPDFRYRGRDASGIVEIECRSVFTASVSHAEMVPDPDESHRCVPWDDLLRTERRSLWALSLPAVLQIGLPSGGGVLPVAAPQP